MNCSSYSKNAMVLKVRGYTRFLTHSIVALRLVIVNLPITQKIRGNISRCIHIEINVAFLLYESTVTIQCPAQFEVEFFV